MTSYTFQAKNRLKSTAEVETTFRKGKYIKCGAYSAKFYFADNDMSEVKFLVSIPKKRISKAVDRNTLKRRTREALRHELPKLKALAKQHSIQMFLAVVYQRQHLLSQAEITKNIETLSALIHTQINSKKAHETNT